MNSNNNQNHATLFTVVLIAELKYEEHHPLA
jgi:hypothetical protein